MKNVRLNEMKDYKLFLKKVGRKYGWNKKLTSEVTQQAFMRYLSDEELLITYEKLFEKKNTLKSRKAKQND